MPPKISSMNFRQLIDLAIGSPEPGHVNFYALHCLLYSFAEKLNIVEKTVDCAKFDLQRKFDKIEKTCTTVRLGGGADPEDPPAEEQPAEAAAEAPPAPADEAPAAAEPEPEAAAEPAAPAVEEPPAAEAAPPPPEEEPAPEAAPEAAAEAAADDVAADDAAADAAGADQQAVAESGSQGSQKVMPVEIAEVKTTVAKIETRVSVLETSIPKAPVTTEIQRGLAVMKDQLETAVEQVINLTNMAFSKKTSNKRMQVMRDLADRLRKIQRENIYIDSTHRFPVDERSLGSDSIMGEEAPEEGEEEGEEDGGLKSDAATDKSAVTQPHLPSDQLDLEMHLCYSPQKLLSQLIDLKSEVCMLNNKVNDVGAAMLEQDSLRTMMLLDELRDGMREMKFSLGELREAIERIDAKLLTQEKTNALLLAKIDTLAMEKIDRTDVEVLLADKANLTDLQRKVSHEELMEHKCRLEKQFCEMTKLIKLNEKNMLQVVESLRTSLGFETIDDILNKFKQKIEVDIHKLHDTLMKYLDATNDDCAAAGARIKVLQDLACLSCDTTCVMRTREKAKVGKMRSLNVNNTIAPLVAYEMGSIRKSGVMGYYRKDEFPHSPNAWLSRQHVKEACVPRHAGGPHTVHTAKEHVDKVLLSKKNPNM